MGPVLALRGGASNKKGIVGAGSLREDDSDAGDATASGAAAGSRAQ